MNARISLENQNKSLVDQNKRLALNCDKLVKENMRLNSLVVE